MGVLDSPSLDLDRVGAFSGPGPTPAGLGQCAVVDRGNITPNGPAPDPLKSKLARPRTPFKSKLGMSLSETGM